MRFERIGGNLALDFANTVHDHGNADPEDDLKSFAELADWGEQAGVLSAQAARRLLRSAATDSSAAARDFARLIALRELVYRIFAAIAAGRSVSSEGLEKLNAQLKDALAHARLTRDGARYVLGWMECRRPADRLLGEITYAAAELLTQGGLRRVRQCAGDHCSWLFVDTSRNGMRRWCDMQSCGNRAKVRRFRKRASTRNK